MVTFMDLEILQGSTFQKEFEYTDSAGDPVDLTGYTARMQIRSTYDKPILLELTTESANIILGTTTGVISLYVSATDTELLNFSKAKYDLELISGEYVYRVLEGSVKLSKEITKED